jgi:hypothetical protein
MSARRIALTAALAALAGCSAPTTPAASLQEGEKCRVDADCATSLCAALPGEGLKCRRACTTICKETEVCTSFGTDAAGKPRAGCVPLVAGLCKACTSNSECPYPADACVKLGSTGVTACGRDCSFDRSCPEGYTCADAIGADGAKAARQCVPVGDTCDCVPGKEGASRDCQITNAFGTCSGKQTCGADLRWTDCDAKAPTQESCNGQDDNCDGTPDDGIPDQNCGRGVCANTAPGCTDGKVPECTPKAAGTETCNGIDDDCDGVIDNGFNLQSDPEHCGSCTNVCGGKKNATTECVAGQCKFTCADGWLDCGAGCTVDKLTDSNHCGDCTTVCTSGGSSTVSCQGGVCRLDCAPGAADCDSLSSTGCEVNLNTLTTPPNCSNLVDLGTLSGDNAGVAPIVRTGRGEATFKIRMQRTLGTCARFFGEGISLLNPAGGQYGMRITSPMMACGTGFDVTYGTPGGLEQTDVCACSYCSNQTPTAAFDSYIEIYWISGAPCGNWTLTLAPKTDSSWCATNCP